MRFNYQKTIAQRTALATLLLFSTFLATHAQVQWPTMDPSNIALFKPAKQSSIWGDFQANRAVDGNTDGDLGHSSVMHTQNNENSWWEVDLLYLYDISDITIYNRMDYTERLDKFSVAVSETPFANNQSGQLVADKQPSFKGSRTFNNVNKKGRYVRIFLNKNEYLHLAEVMVKGKMSKIKNKKGEMVDQTVTSGTNLALGKAARQSSTFEANGANRAVDGNTDGNKGDGSVSHTQADKQPYWEVDLGKNFLIDEVKIYNRTDCCQERLDNFNIWITEQPKDQITGRVVAFVEGEKKFDNGVTYKSFYGTGPTVGRYVRVDLNGQNYLNLAEVQVFGKEVGELSIGSSETQVLYKVSTIENQSGSKIKVKRTHVSTLTQGVEFSRKVNTEHSSHWDLSVEAKASADYLFVKAELDTKFEIGGDTSTSTEDDQSTKVEQSLEETEEYSPEVDANSIFYEFRAFAVNQRPITYQFNGQTYSWYQINEKATANGNSMMRSLTKEQNEKLKQQMKEKKIEIPEDNWISEETYNNLMDIMNALHVPIRE
jgi:hypothetical protein